jgi:uncharacterized protein YjbI with pentapeptide repeats
MSCCKQKFFLLFFLLPNVLFGQSNNARIIENLDLRLPLDTNYFTLTSGTLIVNTLRDTLVGSGTRSVIFKKEIIYSTITFNKEASFNNIIFQNKAIFNQDTFWNKANFSGSIFFDRVNFSFAVFQKQADFSNIIFRKQADFSNLILSDSARFIFNNTLLPDTINFSNINNIQNEIDLSVIRFRDTSRYDSLSDTYKNSKWHFINLYKSDISKFHLDYYHFRLLLLDENCNLLSIDETKSVYEILLKNFKDRGQMDSYESLDIEYHDYLYRNWKLLRWWNLYGYRKQWVFIWIGIFLFFFSVITMLFIDKLNRKDNGVYFVPTIPENIKIDSIKNAFRRFWYSFMYTSTVFFLFSLKIENINFKKGGIIYVIIVYTIGLLCLGYLANFVLQK